MANRNQSPRAGDGAHPAPDALASAAGAVGLVIALNKPVYPLYVWFVAESALHASLLAALTMPLYLAVWFLARKGWSLTARMGVVLVGTADTVMIAFLMGQDSGTLAFLFACIMLGGQAFYASERWLSRTLIALPFVALALLYGRIGAPFVSIQQEDMEGLRYLNMTGAAGLAAFIALRFPRREA